MLWLGGKASNTGVLSVCWEFMDTPSVLGGRKVEQTVAGLWGKMRVQKKSEEGLLSSGKTDSCGLRQFEKHCYSFICILSYRCVCLRVWSQEGGAVCGGSVNLRRRGLARGSSVIDGFAWLPLLGSLSCFLSICCDLL